MRRLLPVRVRQLAQATEIPADKAAWGRGFSVIDERNEDELHADPRSGAKGQVQTQYGDKLGAFYASCMDEAAIETSTPKELKQQLKRVDIMRDLASLQAKSARMHLSVGNPMFEFSQQQDFKDATQVIGALDQGGLGMPDRDYYLSTTGKMPELKKAYQAHVEKMLTLAGEPAEQAKKDAGDGAQDRDGSWRRRRCRAPIGAIRRRSITASSWPASRRRRRSGTWKAYLKEMGVPEVTQINVSSPDFFAALNKMLTATPIAGLEERICAGTSIAQRGAGAVEGVRRREVRVLRQGARRGTEKLAPRWKRCVHGDRRRDGRGARRSRSSKKTLGAEGKATSSDDGAGDRGGDARRTSTKLAWMDDADAQGRRTRSSATIANKIGYPDKWRNYDKLDDRARVATCTNAMRAEAFETQAAAREDRQAGRSRPSGR